MRFCVLQTDVLVVRYLFFITRTFVVGSCKTIIFTVFDVCAVFGLNVGYVCKFLVFVYGEVFVDSCIDLAKRNCDCEIALFEVCALRSRCGVFDKLTVFVIVGVAAPCGICVSNESVIVRGDENVRIVIVSTRALRVFAVCIFNKRLTAPIAAIEVLAACAVHCVEVCNGFVIEHADLESEVDIDTRRVAVEVDRDTARILCVGGAEFGQEFSDALENLAIAACKHTDEVCNEGFVETDGDKVVCDEQSAEHDVEDAPNVCGNQARVGFFVVRRRKRLCGRARCARAENA